MDHPIEEEFRSALIGTPIDEPGVVYQYQVQSCRLWVDLTNHETLDALIESKPASVRKLYTGMQDELARAPLATVAAARAKLDEINAHIDRASARTLPSIVDDVRDLFRVCGFEVRENSGFCELVGSIDAGGILVDAVLEHIKNLADCVALTIPAATSGDAPADLRYVIEFALELAENKSADAAVSFLTAWNWESDTYLRNYWPEFARIERAAAPAPDLESIEQYRLQMATIGTAALGYWKESDGIKREYDTVPLRDVAKLYAKYDAWRSTAIKAGACAHCQRLPGDPDGMCDWIECPVGSAAPATASGDDLPELRAEKIFELAGPWFSWNAPDWRKATQGTIGMPGLLGYTTAAILADRAAVSAATKPAPLDLGKLTRYHHNEHSMEIHDDPIGEFYSVTDVQSLLATKPAEPVIPAPRVEDGELPISRSTYGSLEECEREHARRAAIARQAQPTDRDAVLSEVEAVIEQAIEDLLSKKGHVNGAKFCLEAVRALKGKSGSEGAAK